MPIYLAIVFLLHPLLGIVTLTGAAIMTALLIFNELNLRRPSKELAAATVRRQGQSDDARANTESVFAMGMLPAISRRWGAASAELSRAQQIAADRNGFYSSLTKAFRFLLQACVLATGAYLAIMGEITAGLMVATSIIASRALAPIEQIVGQWRGYVAARQAWLRLRGALVAAYVDPPTVSLPIPRRSLTVTQLATGPTSETRWLKASVSSSRPGKRSGFSARRALVSLR